MIRSHLRPPTNRTRSARVRLLPADIEFVHTRVIGECNDVCKLDVLQYTKVARKEQWLSHLASVRRTSLDGGYCKSVAFRKHFRYGAGCAMVTGAYCNGAVDMAQSLLFLRQLGKHQLFCRYAFLWIFRICAGEEHPKNIAPQRRLVVRVLFYKM